MHGVDCKYKFREIRMRLRETRVLLVLSYFSHVKPVYLEIMYILDGNRRHSSLTKVYTCVNRTVSKDDKPRVWNCKSMIIFSFLRKIRAVCVIILDICRSQTRLFSFPESRSSRTLSLSAVKCKAGCTYLCAYVSREDTVSVGQKCGRFSHYVPDTTPSSREFQGIGSAKRKKSSVG